MVKRKYIQRKRARNQHLTHQRIVEATMTLHEELGPANTTVSAIAKEAGVQRLTVYRHFPDEKALFEACTTRWLELNPMPGPEAWEGEDHPVARIRVALSAFHRYYARTRGMWEGAYRDRDQLPALAVRMDLVEAHLDNLAEGLIDPLELVGEEKKAARVTVRHGLRFPTWLSLEAAGITDPDQSAALVADWLAGACGV